MNKFALPLLGAALLLASCGPNPAPAADTTAPNVRLTATQSGSTVLLAADASDNVSVTRVEFYRGGETTPFATDATAPYTASFPVTSANNGVLNVSARAYDAAGNQGQGGTQVTVNVSPAPTTLYQGVWGWGIIDLGTGALIDNGAVVYSDEATNAGRTAAFGGYVNKAMTRQGYSILGPISAAGKLEVGFTADTNPNNPNVYFIGADDDNQFGVYENQPIFEGGGVVFNASGQPEKDVGVVLIQTSTTVPTGTAAQAEAKAQARALVSRLASQAKVNPQVSALDLSVWKDTFQKAIRQR